MHWIRRERLTRSEIKQIAQESVDEKQLQEFERLQEQIREEIEGERSGELPEYFKIYGGVMDGAVIVLDWCEFNPHTEQLQESETPAWWFEHEEQEAKEAIASKAEELEQKHKQKQSEAGQVEVGLIVLPFIPRKSA